MGVRTSEVGYTIATTRRETTNIHKNMWWHWGEKTIPTVNNDHYIVRFMIYPYLNLVTNSISILNNNEISLNFSLIYFMTYTVLFPRINTFVTWWWSRAEAETCRQFKITTINKLSCILTRLKPSPYSINKHNVADPSKDRLYSFVSKFVFCLPMSANNSAVFR